LKPTITLNDMRTRVGGKLFGDDWIDDLTDDEYELLRDFGPKLEKVHRFDGSTIQLHHIKRVPPAMRSKIDRAIGRQVRKEAQFATVDTWLQKQGFFDSLKGGSLDNSWKLADRSLFNKLLREGFPEEKPTDNYPRTRGRRPEVRRRVIDAMQNDLVSGKISLDQLMDMKEESLVSTYSASRETCRLAVESVCQAAKTIPTKGD
jgi:hypothetical protein